MNDRLGNAQWEPQSEVARKYPYDYRNIWLGRTEDKAAVGYTDDRHICLVSGTRGGKGTSIIVNNLCYWSGSAVVIDPKGENATVTAARRGRGDQYCEGMGQAVHVLDPFGAAQVANEYRSAFNPLDVLDPKNDGAIDEAARIAGALIVANEMSSDPFWNDSARAMVQAVILHVVSGREFEDSERTLLKVHQLLLRGDWEIWGALNAAAAEAGTGPAEITPHKLLWQSMQENPAFGGMVAGAGSRFSVMSDKTMDGVLQTAITNLDFLNSPPMQRVLARSDFQLSELKTNPRGLTLYLSLPQSYMETHFRWLRMMVALTTSQMEITRGRPATGHRVLMILDEFAGLQRMRSIETSVAQIAGFGVKLFFVLQSLEQLKNHYKDNWETFLSNAGLKIFFSIEDNFTREYVSKLIGNTEIIRDLHSSNEGQSESDSAAEGWSSSTGRTQSSTRGQSASQTDGTSDTETAGTSHSINQGRSESQNWSSSRSETTGSSSSRSESHGGTGSKTYKDTFSYLVGQILPIDVARTEGWSNSFGESMSYSSSNSIGENWGGSSGTSRGVAKGTSSSQAHGRSTSTTAGTSASTSDGTSETNGTSGTTTRGSGRSSGTGRSQTLQKRPLLPPEEFGKLFARIDNPKHPAYPGFGLVLIAGGDPVVVMRAHYFDDPQFIDCFSPHPDHQFLPAVAQEVYGAKPLLDMLSIANGGRDLVGDWEIVPHQVVFANQRALVFPPVIPGNGVVSIRTPCAGKVVRLGGLSLNDWHQARGAQQRFALMMHGSALTIKHYGQVKTVDPLAELKAACEQVLAARPKIEATAPRASSATAAPPREPAAALSKRQWKTIKGVAIVLAMFAVLVLIGFASRFMTMTEFVVVGLFGVWAYVILRLVFRYDTPTGTQELRRDLARKLERVKFLSRFAARLRPQAVSPPRTPSSQRPRQRPAFLRYFNHRFIVAWLRFRTGPEWAAIAVVSAGVFYLAIKAIF